MNHPTFSIIPFAYNGIKLIIIMLIEPENGIGNKVSQLN